MTSEQMKELMNASIRALVGTCLGLVGVTLLVVPVFAANEEGLLEEVVVFAQKRAQGSQSVPIAVTALTDEMMRETGLLTIQNLTQLNPSVSFDTAQSWQNSSLKVRGIGTIGNTRSFEGAVGVFLDGVYRSRSGMAINDLLDISRLEVLRGPQSTLFGKNTVAGAITLKSTRPDLENFNGNAEVRFGDHGFTYLMGNINAPLNSKSGFRAAASLNKRDGFFQSPDTGDEYDAVDRYGLKAQYLLQPSDNWEVLIIADHNESDAPCCWGSAQVVNGPTSPLIEAYSGLNGFSFVQAPLAEENRAHTLNAVPRELVIDSGVLAQIEWAGNNNWSARSITAMRNWEHSQLSADADFVAADLFLLNEPSDIDSFSQELNFNYTKDNLDLLLGVYYSTEDYFSLRSAETGADADNYVNALISANFGAAACLPPIVELDCLFPSGIGALLPDGEFAREAYFQDSTGYALFSHLNYSLSDRLTLVAGLRYDSIDKEGGVNNLFWYDSAIARATLELNGLPDDGTPRNGLDLIGTFNSPSFSDKREDTEVTGTIQLQYDLSSYGMIYGGFHRGFKAGGVNLFREGAITNTTYVPEIAESFEAGIKLDYLGGRARSNIAIFHTEFSDLQINFFTGLEFRTENTGKSSSKGIEIENTWQVNDQFRVDLSATYLRAKFDRIDNPFLSYLVGRDTPRAPKWSGMAAARYDWFFANEWSVYTNGLLSWSGSHYVGADAPSEPKASSYIVGDFRVGLVTPGKRWDLSVWCRNCTDESYRTIYFNSTFQPDSFSVYLNDPRQYGLTFRYSF